MMRLSLPEVAGALHYDDPCLFLRRLADLSGDSDGPTESSFGFYFFSRPPQEPQARAFKSTVPPFALESLLTREITDAETAYCFGCGPPGGRAHGL